MLNNKYKAQYPSMRKTQPSLSSQWEDTGTAPDQNTYSTGHCGRGQVSSTDIPAVKSLQDSDKPKEPVRLHGLDSRVIHGGGGYALGQGHQDQQEHQDGGDGHLHGWIS
eukprot:TRINITY_DN71_c0_g1_i2.p1 TRINITY_DN71_c0_g1~~TRINITY_DN71_c0_g1_i2.p1  ORF type:complete len:109 (-),score=26.05 TRINITY_DN71_c0_g1_i2:42-368(-)